LKGKKVSDSLKTYSNFIHNKEHEYWDHIKEIQYYVSFQLGSLNPEISLEKSMGDILDQFSARDYLAIHSELYNESFNPKKIVDLGCGTGRFSCFVNMNLKDKISNIKFYLADFNRCDEVLTRFDGPVKPTSVEVFSGRQGYVDNAEPLPYNEFKITNLFCSYYGLTNYENIDLDTNEINKLENIDLLYSMSSVGFHWSIESAVEKYNICSILKNGGKMICQIDPTVDDKLWEKDMSNLFLKNVIKLKGGHMYAIWEKKC